MTLQDASPVATLRTIDDATHLLVRVAAVVAAGSESEIRAELSAAAPEVPHLWIEELLLQSYLFAGFPRALNSFREWRRIAPASQSTEVLASDASDWQTRGVATCKAVY